MIEYRVAFDLLEAGYQHWGYSLFGLACMAAGFGLYVLGKTALRNSHPILRDLIPKAVLAVTAIFTLVAFLPTYLPYRSMRIAFENGEAEITEGVVSSFEAQRSTEDQPERFKVGERAFQYSDYAMTPGFHTSQARGGPLKEGLHVRIAHIGGTIVKLEIAD